MVAAEANEPRVDAAGRASFRITENGKSEEVNTEVNISVDRACRWQGRADRPSIESNDLAVRKFMRRAIYEMRPDPTPRPVSPAPKPAGPKLVPAASAPTEVVCPACRGTGETLDMQRGLVFDCDLCETTGRVSVLIARVWREEHR